MRERERELEQGRPEVLILRVDRTDPSKNVVRGFRAYELYLDAHPEMHGRVQMLALLDPSRQDIPEYAEYVGAIQREARRDNDRYAPVVAAPTVPRSAPHELCGFARRRRLVHRHIRTRQRIVRSKIHQVDEQFLATPAQLRDAIGMPLDVIDVLQPFHRGR